MDEAGWVGRFYEAVEVTLHCVGLAGAGSQFHGCKIPLTIPILTIPIRSWVAGLEGKG